MARTVIKRNSAPRRKTRTAKTAKQGRDLSLAELIAEAEERLGYSICAARRTKAGGMPCEKPRGWGTDHAGYGRCKLHGGSHRNGRMAAMREEINALAPSWSIPADVDPMTGLLVMVRYAAAHVEYWHQERLKLDPRDYYGPVVTKHRRPLKYEKGEESRTIRVNEVRRHGAQKHLVLVAHEEAMDRFTRYCDLAIKGGVAQAQVDIAANYGALIAKAFDVYAHALQLTAAQLRESPRALELALRVMEGEATDVV